ncbi:hypothetical protein KXX16_003913 [Aspergillus fumigatus]|nr:hypothetical protein KXX67_004406 [Aspergillus fumigatus]KMK61967.1 hypothetical protein Y699_02808 [Aspergillus fumigatus Z5]KAH1373205.1 hypothetical protein KXX50_002945 [Aspergillus fumigatus]KAH1401395.1 hypothetical protein KXX51_003875 [Aspergillus fumigatus]KAH1430690.1 hypothetical protein KXX32_003742 [Aspergillus fumigatus]
MTPADADAHPLVRNALRITLSAKEYKLLHEYIIQRTPPSIKDKAPSPSRYEAIVRSKNKHNEAALRASLRVFLVSGGLLKLVEAIVRRIQGDMSKKKPRSSILHSPNFRLSLSLSLVVLLHRFLYRFFVKLRTNLRTDDARPFRERNPRVSRALTSRYAPAVGASMAGFALGICPQTQLRITAAIYAGTRTMEFVFNALDEKGWFGDRPWWFASWLLMPVSCAQLFHAFVFDRETVPKWFGNILFRLCPSYIRGRPESLPAGFPWPDKEAVVDSLANIARLRWPAFISPILHPADPNTLPSAVKFISPITGPAHPSISSLACALLHPSSPSCGTAFVHHILLSVPPLARFLTTVTLALSVLKFKTILSHPISAVNSLSKKIIKLTAILSAAAGSAWGTLCLWHVILPRSVLPTKRFFLSGAVAGIPFAFLENSRSIFMYFFRLAVRSKWDVGVKNGLWKGWKGGDLWIIVLAWAVMGSLLEHRPSPVQGKGVRKSLAWLRGDGFVDPVEAAAKKKARKSSTQKQPGNEARA